MRDALYLNSNGISVYFDRSMLQWNHYFQYRTPINHLACHCSRSFMLRPILPACPWFECNSGLYLHNHKTGCYCDRTLLHILLAHCTRLLERNSKLNHHCWQYPTYVNCRLWYLPFPINFKFGGKFNVKLTTFFDPMKSRLEDTSCQWNHPEMSLPVRPRNRSGRGRHSVTKIITRFCHM